MVNNVINVQGITEGQNSTEVNTDAVVRGGLETKMKRKRAGDISPLKKMLSEN